MTLIVTELSDSEQAARDSSAEQAPESKPKVIKVCDGWYEVRASLDQALCDVVARGRLRVGDKIVTYGAELVGVQDACHPLQVRTSPYCYVT